VKLDFTTVERWAKLIRDIGLIIGVPAVIALGSKLYELQIAAVKAHSEVLEAQNNFLKETQYDRAATLLVSQKKVYEMEREHLQKQIAALEQEGSEKTEELARLQKQRQGVDNTLQALTAISTNLAELRQNMFPVRSEAEQRQTQQKMMEMLQRQTATPTPADGR
jgi:chromosome segregation ATPase